MRFFVVTGVVTQEPISELAKLKIKFQSIKLENRRKFLFVADSMVSVSTEVKKLMSEWSNEDYEWSIKMESVMVMAEEKAMAYINGTDITNRRQRPINN